MAVAWLAGMDGDRLFLIILSCRWLWLAVVVAVLLWLVVVVAA